MPYVICLCLPIPYLATRWHQPLFHFWPIYLQPAAIWFSPNDLWCTDDDVDHQKWFKNYISPLLRPLLNDERQSLGHSPAAGNRVGQLQSQTRAIQTTRQRVTNSYIYFKLATSKLMAKLTWTLNEKKDLEVGEDYLVVHVCCWCRCCCCRNWKKFAELSPDCARSTVSQAEVPAKPWFACPQTSNWVGSISLFECKTNFCYYLNDDTFQDIVLLQ